MPDPVALISTSPISRAELADFVSRMGGDIVSRGNFVGTIQRNNDAIWIGLSDGELESIVEDNRMIYEKLAGPPTTLVIIETIKGKGSRELARDFAVSFTGNWAAICSDGSGGFMSHGDLVELREKSPDLSLRSRVA